MKKLFGILFIFPFVVLATSKTYDEKPKNLTDKCELSAKFLRPKGMKQTGGPGRTSKSENAVYWEIEPIESIGANCPKERVIFLRIRSADFKGTTSEPVFVYPVDVVEPKPSDLIRLMVRFVEGKNTFLNRKYSEWLLIEQLND